MESTGAIVTDEDCPVVVENEQLTFDLAEFPEHGYGTAADYLAYSGKVTAQYTFCNPADYTVTVQLAFPLGPLPDYAYWGYDEQAGKNVGTDDTAKYSVTADGQTIGKTVRHTFSSDDQFDPEEDLALLHDGYAEDDFYAPELPVTRYTYTVSGVNAENDAACAAADFPAFDGTRRYMLVDQDSGSAAEDGTTRAGTWVENGTEITLYVLGEPLTQDVEWRIYEDGGLEDWDEIEGTVALRDTAEGLTFRELALQGYSAESGVLESDWYNAIVAFSNENT